MAGYYYDYGGGGFVHSLPTNLASKCHFPAHGQPPVPTGGPPWSPREPHHVGFPSSWA